MRRSPLRKKGKSDISKLQDKADKLLTPLAKKRNPLCEHCNNPTQVGHHWVEKSRSSNLRYNLDNIISLCNSCHFKIHNRAGSNILGSVDIVDDIIQKRGQEWADRMKREGDIIIKVDKFWYEEQINKLTQILNE